MNIKANFKKGVLYLNSNLIGDYNFENIMAAACIGNYFKVDPLNIQEALKAYYPGNNRSQMIIKGNLKIIMDAYNANPTSMKASLKSFLAKTNEDNHLILGDMLELGTYSETEHEEILELIRIHNPAGIYLVGPMFSELAVKYGYRSFASVDELNRHLIKNPIKKGNLLIKGSRSILLEKVLDFLN